MKRQKIFKTVLSLVLALLLISGNILGYAPVLVNANGVSTDISNSVAGGTGSDAATQGAWSTWYSPCIYRFYVVQVTNPDNLDKVADANKVVKIPQQYHYYYKNIALYEMGDFYNGGTTADEAKGAYAFDSATTRTSSTVGGLTLGTDSDYSFSEIGLDLDLPSQKLYTKGSSGFVLTQIDNELSDNIRTEDITDDEDNTLKANVQSILLNYIKYMDKKLGGTSGTDLTPAQTALKVLKEQSGYNTANWNTYSRKFGICIELCGVAKHNASGIRYVVSYSDLIETGIKDDANNIYQPLNNFNLTWTAKYNIKPEYKVLDSVLKDGSSAKGRAVFLLYNATELPEDSIRSHALNITVRSEGAISSSGDLKSTLSSYKVVTSKLDATAKLGFKDYKGIVRNAKSKVFGGANGVKNATFTIFGKTSSSNDTRIGTIKTKNGVSNLEALSGTSSDDYSGYKVKSYAYVPITANKEGKNGEVLSYKFSDMFGLNTSNTTLTNALSSVKTKTSSTPVAGNVNLNTYGYGSTYTTDFVVVNSNNQVTTAKAGNKVLSNVGLNGTWSLGSIFNVDDWTDNSANSLKKLANLQSAALLSGKITGTQKTDANDNVIGLTAPSGKIYATVSFLYKDTRVTSKFGQIKMTYNDSTDVIDVTKVKDKESATHSVEDKAPSTI